MRYSEIIVESVATYRPLFSGFPTTPSIIDDIIKAVEGEFKRKDRVTLALKVQRVILLNRLIRNGRIKLDDLDKKFLSRIGNLEYDGSHYETLVHYLSMVENYPFLDNISWDVSYEKLVSDFESQKDRIEKYAAKRNDNTVQRKDGDVPIIKFPNGWAWWRLSRGGCEDEARVMGHCGNGSGSRYENILSLRQTHTNGSMEPHLTFIWNNDTGMLGEMKGRANEKPAKRYHDMIVALLRHDSITGIVGGGYLPANNFSTRDLPPDIRDALLKEKPTLRPFKDAWDDAVGKEQQAEVIEQYSGFLNENPTNYALVPELLGFVNDYSGEKFDCTLSDRLVDILSEIQAHVRENEETDMDQVKRAKRDLVKLFYDEMHLGFEYGYVEYSEANIYYDIDDLADIPQFRHIVPISDYMDNNSWEDDTDIMRFNPASDEHEWGNRGFDDYDIDDSLEPLRDIIIDDDDIALKIIELYQ